MKPSHFYFDEYILEQEQLLFGHARYLGHELSVNNYKTLPQDQGGRVLVKNDQGIECLENVCRHRQAVMLQGSGETKNIVCPLHGWTYDLEGKLVGAPHFDPCPNRDLRKFATQNWNGLFFESGKFNIVQDLILIIMFTTAARNITVIIIGKLSLKFI
jgi:choline monooxygenase